MPIDMGSISALVSSLQSAVEIAKVMKGLRDEAAIQSKVIELQGVIMSAQSSALAAQTDQFALLDKVRALESQINDMRDWQSEKQRYELQQIDRGSFAYVLRPETNLAEPPHWLCAACFQKGRKSILQYHGRAQDQPRRALYKCPDCAAAIGVQYELMPQ